MLKALWVAVFAACLTFPSQLFSATTRNTLNKEQTEQITLEGVVDMDMLKTVRASIKKIQESNGQLKALRINITSPGGYALIGAELAKTLRELSDSGVTVEFNASVLCASACTVILAAGTPGYRHITRQTLFIVHSLQSGGMLTSCVDYKEKASDQDEKASNIQWLFLRDLYVKFTGKPVKDVNDWMTCGHEQVGDGSLAIKLGIADIVDK